MTAQIYNSNPLSTTGAFSDAVPFREEFRWADECRTIDAPMALLTGSTVSTDSGAVLSAAFIREGYLE